MEIVQDYKTPFKVASIQVEARNSKIMNEKQLILANQDIESILSKGTIQKVLHVTKEFLRNMFLVDKADGGKRPVPEDPKFQNFICQHFKMENLYLFKDLLGLHV